jgi:hypothetical protein
MSGEHFPIRFSAGRLLVHATSNAGGHSHALATYDTVGNHATTV